MIPHEEEKEKTNILSPISHLGEKIRQSRRGVNNWEVVGTQWTAGIWIPSLPGPRKQTGH